MSRTKPEALYLTDGEIAARLGVSVEKWQAAATALKGLPPVDPVFEFRRYWPAVKAYLDRRAGVNLYAGPVQDGEETFEEDRNHRRVARAR